MEHSLAGSDDSLRERVIGIEVFGRTPAYDTAEDPVVRLRAADIRKRLAQYYQAGKSAPGQWKIDIPTGSYKAQFRPSEPVSSDAAATATVRTPPLGGASLAAEPTLVSSQKPRKRKLLWASVSVAGLIVVLSAALFLNRNSYAPAGPFDQFWAPVLQNSRPVLVCTGSNRVYRLSEEARARYRKSHPHQEDLAPNLEVLVPRDELKNFAGADFSP